eukprot:CAMPEP_0184350614 /NCGR_PEP_ID=MMETSP1089-20130417/39531_1 /TAXON_ID=38269 ORGANISM="Gloeochaete wittrockiana, Strain SAG46.84" /NCGR_SAMPLE_ID=MMETSP1089 /ASSEMBLY_ACC=CAM_ASM_000445 /LENGTH=92 /DNA_ID=CAMNT_0026683467 /DNA_START=30 /DNA_END=308 /DNA_ORIENTATION=+
MSAELNLGQQANAIAEAKFQEWVESSMVVIRKTVIDMANRGLYHCNIRFEDILPQDPVNQEKFIQFLAKEGLAGNFLKLEQGVQLTLSWAHP